MFHPCAIAGLCKYPPAGGNPSFVTDERAELQGRRIRLAAGLSGFTTSRFALWFNPIIHAAMHRSLVLQTR
jgi:hypothetical protein